MTKLLPSKLNLVRFFGAMHICLAAAHAVAADPLRVDDATRAAIIKDLKQKIGEEYVFPDKARQVVARLEAQEQAGAYAGMHSLKDLAEALTNDLQQPTKDLHLMVRVSTNPIPAKSTKIDKGRNPEMDKIVLARMKSISYGVRKVEALTGNIGYIDLSIFAPNWFAEEAIGAAMTLVADTDALIVDLRNNYGGDGITVALMSSYLFDRRTHLNDMYWRKGDRTEESWTRDEVSGKRFGGVKKVYVLTSKKTFSAAEDFGYGLQQLKRATLVGEVTGGGAQAGHNYRLHPHLAANIPSGRSINPITKTNWEGTGVTPDIAVPEDEALRTAQQMALQALLTNPRDTAHADLLRKRLDELKR